MIRKLLFKNFIWLHRGSLWLRSQFTRTGLMILSVLVAAAIFGIDTRQTHAYQIFSFLLCLVIFSIFSSFFSRGKVRVKRNLPEFATAGQTVQYQVAIENTSGKKLNNIQLHDQLRVQRPSFTEFLNTRDLQDKQRNIFDRVIGYPRLANLIRNKRGADIGEVDIDEIKGHEVTERKVDLLPLRRGYIYFDKSIIARLDPLGLFKKRMIFNNPARLLILPKCYQMPEIHLDGSRKYQPGGLSLSTSVGDSEEFFSLRDYRPGDPVKYIHWRSYARRGEPVIKEYQDEFFSRIGLVLDTYLDGKPGYLFEEAVSVAASVVISNRQQDSLLDLLLVNNGAFRMTSGRGLAEAENMLEVLACVENSREENFPLLADLVNIHSFETSGFILVTMHWDDVRKNLVRQLRAMKIPVFVLVITDKDPPVITDDDPMSDQPDYFWVLEADNIQESLNKHHLLNREGIH